MKTNNELIAEFMGWNKDSAGLWLIHNGYAGRVRIRLFSTNNLIFDTSWNWLMPVVEKINTLMPKINIPDDLESLKNENHGSEEHIEVIALPLSTPIGEAYTAVIKFIKWYNNQPKP